MAEQVEKITGLTSDQVAQQIAKGNQNTSPAPLTHSIKEIFHTNIVTLFNLINVVLGLFVLYTGSYKNLLFLGIVFFNTAIGIIQEIRSKRQIDKMAILAEGKVQVIRDGKIQSVMPEELVLDDVILLERGDQVPVDGVILTSQHLEVNESQITGEAQTITKIVGDPIISATYVESGSAQMRATKVGKDTFVNHLSEEARSGSDTNSILLATINKIIKTLTYVIIPLGIALFISKMISSNDVNRAILGTVAAMTGMIPEGLVLLTSVTLAVSAANLARKRVLVRDLPAIETLARVDTICLDKTGTITSGDLRLDKIVALNGKSDAAVTKLVSQVAYGTGDENETARAIKAGVADPNVQPTAVHPFSSARKWSAVTLSDGQTAVLGAPQFIFGNLSSDIQASIDDYAKQGFRVLAVATADAIDGDKIVAPKLWGLVLITDVIRPNAVSTFAFFRKQGVKIKVISGDDPTTVSTIARNAGIEDAQNFVDMSKVSDDQLAEVALSETVFGRVTPDQKQRLIKAMQDDKHTVAMTGDGVNDLLALRQADCGIAMASGSESTKSIADFVLIDSDFNSMVGVLNEGRRVINNIEQVASMYLIKTMYSVALSFIFIFMTTGYPFEPIQLTPITSLMVGFPSFVLALQPNFGKITNQFLKQVLKISLPAALLVVSYIMIIEVLGFTFHLDYRFTSTLCVLLTGTICWLSLVMVSRPLNRLKIILDLGVLIAFVTIIIFFNSLFSLVSFFNPAIWLFAVPLILTVYPVYIVVQGVIVSYLNRSKRFKDAV
ncbi:HAD-IC family P-type ATPase [Lentilactobacillus senioris]|uniref:HAD-IC family P-type ATPase n=1 Tax=Lentilactobacillus senioris TaxID=931534 RepID=UPI003D27B862